MGVGIVVGATDALLRSQIKIRVGGGAGETFSTIKEGRFGWARHRIAVIL